MKRLPIILLISFATLIGAGIAGCTDTIENGYNSQEKKIDSYVTTLLNADSTRTATRLNGATRVTLVHGSGEALTEKGNIVFRYGGYTFSDKYDASALFATNDSTFAANAGWGSSVQMKLEPLTVNLAESGFLSGLHDGLIGVQTGEQCYIIFSGKYGFGNEAVGIIPRTSALLYYVLVDGVSND